MIYILFINSVDTTIEAMAFCQHKNYNQATMNQIIEKTKSSSLTRLISVIGILALVILGTRLILAPLQEVPSSVDTGIYMKLSQISEHIHALSACIFVVLSIGAIATKKGAEKHRIYGKLGVLLVFLALLSAAVLLLYLVIQNPSGVYSTRVMINENSALLFTVLASGSYGALTGYRWAAFPQPKLDLDLVSGVFAILGSIFGIALIPFAVFIDPMNVQDIGFPLTPFAAGLLLSGQSALLGYFGYDDIRGFFGKNISKTERVVKHTYRIMSTVGGTITAVAIIHLGPVIINYPSLVWLLYLVPPSAIFALTIYLKKSYLSAANS